MTISYGESSPDSLRSTDLQRFLKRIQMHDALQTPEFMQQKHAIAAAYYALRYRPQADGEERAVRTINMKFAFQALERWLNDNPAPGELLPPETKAPDGDISTPD